MRSAVLSDVLQITSSRQSPKISAVKQGVCFVPLFAEHSDAVSNRVSLLDPYLSMWLPSRSSRITSASHQTRKLSDPGARPIFLPWLSI